MLFARRNDTGEFCTKSGKGSHYPQADLVHEALTYSDAVCIGFAFDEIYVGRGFFAASEVANEKDFVDRCHTCFFGVFR